MKKGLLSLLALALTVVGCQNYDDQFAELTSQITDLQSTVDGLTGVSSAISSLQSTVAGLSTSLGAVQTSVNGLSNYDDSSVVAQLATISQTLASLAASISNVATTGDLDAISSTLSDVQADVRELLAANAVINQDITINNSATLEYAQTLIATGENDPNVIINGKVTIDCTNLSAAQIADVQIIVGKFATILGDGAGAPGLKITSTTPLNLTNLTFLDDDYTIIGSDQNDVALVTVSGALSIDHAAASTATLDYSHLASVGAITISAQTAEYATAVNFSNVDGTTIQRGTGATGDLEFENALSVNLGDFPLTAIDAPKAVSIDSAVETVAALTIDADNATNVRFNSLTDATGTITVNASSTSNVFFNLLDTAAIIDADSQKVATFHIPALAETGGAVDIDAGTINASGLVTITHATDFHTVATPMLGSLVRVNATLAIDNGPINLPNAVFNAALTSAATTVIVAGDTNGALTNLGANVDFLTLTAQAVAVTGVPATIVTIDATVAGGDGATEDFTVASTATALRGVTVSGFDVVTIGAAGAGTGVTTITTAGTIRNFVSIDNASVAEINIGHTWDDSYTDAQVITVTGNTSLESLDLATVVRLEAATITGNTSLATIMAPATNDPLTPGATTALTVTGNSLTATYTVAEAAVQDGINNTPYQQATIAQPSLESWKDYVLAISATNSPVTFDFDYDASSNTGNTNFASDVADDTDNNAAPAFAGTIDTLAELAIIN